MFASTSCSVSQHICCGQMFSDTSFEADPDLTCKNCAWINHDATDWLTHPVLYWHDSIVKDSHLWTPLASSSLPFATSASCSARAPSMSTSFISSISILSGRMVLVIVSLLLGPAGSGSAGGSFSFGWRKASSFCARQSVLTIWCA